MTPDWTLTGLIPTSGLIQWALYDPATSTNGNVNDASGNGLHMVQAGTAPALTTNVHNGVPGWLFDGSTTEPLQTVSSDNITAKHVFVFASYADAAFSVNNRGLLSGKNSGNWLTSESSGTQFFDFGAGGDYTYYKSGTEYGDNSMEAPMSGNAELIEMTHTTTGVITDGLQVGRQTGDATRIWKGYWHEQLIYDTPLTGDDLLRVYLYFNIKYQANRSGLELRFPDIEMLAGTGIMFGSGKYARFREIPEDFDHVTDRWEYEDGMEDFNEVSSIVPHRWELSYRLHNNDQQTIMAQKAIFDYFYRTARKAIPFTFRDKWGVEWSNVRIEEYDNPHDAHRSWDYSINFRLKTNTGTAVPAGMASAAVLENPLTFEGDELTFNP